ncbi:MAG TPA: DUF4010 domain-containing protein, partial [Fodinibius sp.]|nr:DUF4010 domain-containing protein [Fodinibius sp.]
VLNPRNIWLMVVLIVGISILGYFIYKWQGKDKGMISNGILGGIISSTATTVSYAKTTKSNKGLNRTSAFVILAAVTVSLIRVIVEIAVVIPEKLTEIIFPFIVYFAFMAVLTVILFYKTSEEKQGDEMPEPKNVAQFKTALVFGLLYGLVLLAVAFTEDKFGESGLYIVSVIGGLAKKDAIVLSLAYSIENGLDVSLGWRLIMTGVLANFAFKILIVALVGSRRLTKVMGVVLSASVIVGILIMVIWP